MNQRQHEAVVASLTSAVFLIAGGAGSGKTYTVSAITKIYQDAKHTVVLAAPTGKAAKRLEQVVGIPAQTLHRLLGYNGRSFQRGADLPIEADLLVVDEAGMIEVVLGWHLLQAIDFRRTAVVFVGDHNQLSGTVMQDALVDFPSFSREPSVGSERTRRVVHGETDDMHLSPGDLAANLPRPDVSESEDGEEWLSLLASASRARGAKKVNVEPLILSLCRGCFLTRSQLALLLDRSELTLRNKYLGRMVKNGELEMSYPEKPTSTLRAYRTREDDALPYRAKP